MTMTEVAGLLFGLCGASWLLLFSTNGNTASLIAGVSAISIGLAARAGAFFALPALVLWAGLCARSKGRGFWKSGASAAAACAVGFCLQSGLVALTGGPKGQSFGNFSYILYGLVSGGQGWLQVSKDHPEISELSDREANQRIYQLAGQRFLRSPWDTVRGLWRNFCLTLSVGSYGFWMVPPILAVTLKFFWWIALIPLLKNPLCQRNALILSVSGANFISAMFLYDLSYGEGLSRIFAATVWADALQIVVGAWFSFALAARLLGKRFALPVSPNDNSSVAGNPEHQAAARPWLEALLTGLILVPLLVALIAAVGMFGKLEGAKSRSELDINVVDFVPGAGASLGIYFQKSGIPDWSRWGACKENVLSSLPRWNWWREGLEKVEVGTVWYIPVSPNESVDGSSVLRLYSPTIFDAHHSQKVRVVYDEKKMVSLFGEKHAEILSVRTLSDNSGEEIQDMTMKATLD